jgi:type I restriction enzyme, S subunit
VKFGDLVTVSKGKKPIEIHEVAMPGDRRLLQIEDLRDGAIPRYCPAAHNEVLAEEIDLVLAWDGANAGTSGSPDIDVDRGACGMGGDGQLGAHGR